MDRLEKKLEIQKKANQRLVEQLNEVEMINLQQENSFERARDLIYELDMIKKEWTDSLNELENLKSEYQKLITETKQLRREIKRKTCTSRILNMIHKS